MSLGLGAGCVGVIQRQAEGEVGSGGTGGSISGETATGGNGPSGTGNSGTGTGATGAGTTGTGGTVGGTDPGGTGGIVTTGMRSTPGDLPLPRLSHDEYLQTIKDLMTQVLPASDATQVISTVIPMMGDLPQDALVTVSTEKHGGFSRADQTEQQQYSDVPVNVASAVGTALTSTPARITALFGTCSSGGTSVNAACLQSFVKSFGEIALRHPLSDDDVAFYVGTAPAAPTSADLARVIAVLLASPRFLYRVESGAATLEGNTYALDAWELASRLSYFFWSTMPDAALRDAAKSGKLLTEAGYNSEVDRLMADPKADLTLRSFFQQWFWPLIELPPLDSRAGDPAYKAFAGANLPGPALKDHVINDVLDAASWVTSHKGTLTDLFTSRLSFARDADLAAIYGVPVWNGKDTPTMLPASRVGLLTRAAFLATGTINSRPIMKGVFIRTTLLCDPIPPPPPNAATTPIATNSNQTTRQVIEAITEMPNSSCSGCHKSLINPLGFASENFDGLGRERTQQTFFDDTGKVTGSGAVDTTSVPGVVGGDASPSKGIGDVTQLILQSGKLQTCLAKRFFRFAFRRIEGSVDSDTVNALADLATHGTLSDLFKGLALRPEFRQRVISQ